MMLTTGQVFDTTKLTRETPIKIIDHFVRNNGLGVNGLPPHHNNMNIGGNYLVQNVTIGVLTVINYYGMSHSIEVNYFIGETPRMRIELYKLDGE